MCIHTLKRLPQVAGIGSQAAMDMPVSGFPPLDTCKWVREITGSALSLVFSRGQVGQCVDLSRIGVDMPLLLMVSGHGR